MDQTTRASRSLVVCGALREVRAVTLDLDAYLARLGLPSAPRPDEAGLFALHTAQALAIPFENVDVLLGRGVPLALDRLESKLVARRRGGYCFELNGLMLHALRALGFDARPLLGRVTFNRPPEAGMPPRSHQVSAVSLGARTFLVDVGFGLTMREPIALEPEREWVQQDDVYRVQVDARGWGVEWRPASEPERAWMPLYTLTLDEVFDIDLVVANHYTSTHPESHFLQMPRIARVLSDGRATMLGDRLTIRRGGEVTTRTVPRGDALRSTLLELFDIDVDASDDVLDRAFHRGG